MRALIFIFVFLFSTNFSNCYASRFVVIDKVTGKVLAVDGAAPAHGWISFYGQAEQAHGDAGSDYFVADQRYLYQFNWNGNTKTSTIVKTHYDQGGPQAFFSKGVCTNGKNIFLLGEAGLGGMQIVQLDVEKTTAAKTGVVKTWSDADAVNSWKGLCYDGQYFYTTTANTDPARLLQLDLDPKISTFKIMKTWELADGENDITFDGQYFWTIKQDSDSTYIIKQYDRIESLSESGESFLSVVFSFSITVPAGSLCGIATDGNNLIASVI